MMKIMIQGQSVWTCFSLHKWFLASWRNILRASGASPIDPHQGCAPGPRWETSVPQTRPPASAPPKPKYWIRPWFRTSEALYVSKCSCCDTTTNVGLAVFRYAMPLSFPRAISTDEPVRVITDDVSEHVRATDGLDIGSASSAVTKQHTWHHVNNTVWYKRTYTVSQKSSTPNS